MNKPVIFFQFDYEEYRKKQYQVGYFDYKRDGFGPVVSDVNDLLQNLISIYEDGLDEKFLRRNDNFFELKDKKNSERIYKVLKGSE